MNEKELQRISQQEARGGVDVGTTAEAFRRVAEMSTPTKDTTFAGNAQLSGEGATSDTISRRAAIDAVLSVIPYDDYWKEQIEKVVNKLPSAQPDLSEYSDKLWRNAYERGRKEAMEEIIRCKDCKWGDWYTSVDRKRYCYCMETGNGGRTEDDFCSYAERQGK